MAIDLSKLSPAQLLDLAKQAQELAVTKQNNTKELKLIVDACVKQANDMGFTADDVVALIKGDKGSKPARTVNRNKPPQQYVDGVVYRSADKQRTWIGGSKGAKPGWLRDLLAGGKTFADLAT